jgi:hypothetical protein
MAKLFYDHLVVIEEIIVALTREQVSKEELDLLLATIDETLHHEILTTILTHLPKAHHEEFLHKYTHQPHDTGILAYLHEKSGKNMELEIMKTVEKIKKDIFAEIRKSKTHV